MATAAAEIATGDKVYWKATVDSWTAACGVGVANSSFTPNTALGSDTTSIRYLTDGSVRYNGNLIATLLTYTAGDTVYVAVDYNNGKIWFKKNAGNWNNDAGANPATNTGGITIGVTGSLWPAAAVTGSGGNSSLTIVFTDAAGMPSGFSLFPQDKHFQLITTAGDGSWTVPTGVTTITVELWGGGATPTAASSQEGGGGGGGFISVDIPVTAGQSLYYTVGGPGGGTIATTHGAAPGYGGKWWYANSGNVNGTGGSAGGTSAPDGTQNVAYNGGAGAAAQGGGGSRAGSGGGGAAGPAGSGANGTAGASNSPGYGGDGSYNVGGTEGGAGGNSGSAAGGANEEGGGGGAGGASGQIGGNGGAPGGGAGGGGNGQATSATGGRGQLRIFYTVEVTGQPDTPLTAGIPVLGTPALGQKHVLSNAAEAAGSPVLGTPALSIIVALPAANALTTSAPVLGTPAIGVVHNLANAAETYGVPVLGTPLLTILAHNLTANALTTSAPALGTPTIGQKHVLPAANALTTSAPALWEPAMGHIHNFTATALATSSPAVGSPAIGQVHALIGLVFNGGLPVIDQPSPFVVIDTENVIVRPATVSAAGGWTDQSGGTAIIAAIDEVVADDADYGQSEADPVDDVLRLKLASFSATSLHRELTLRYRVGRTGGTVTQTVRLYQSGTATVGSGTLIGGPWSHSASSPTTYEQAIDATTVTDPNDLYVEVEAG